jgi:pSer/pThr/pTyr-binding forkhead associated (FHA) protein
MMRVIVQIVTGPYTDRTIELEPGRVIRVGRTERSDFAIPHDAYLSSRHFALECDHTGCRVRDLESTHGTFVNGKQIKEVTLTGGDEIVAGDTIFVVHFEGERRRLEPVEANEGSAATTPEEKLLVVLRGQFQPLYAILDAARDPAILKLLKGSETEYQSLYEGVQAQVLEEYAPYLVRLPNDSRFLETLVREGWGKNWGVYLTCYKPFKDVRRHFRHFLKVELTDGQQVYFRFYDPRVLPVFLPTCTPEQATQFFGPVSYCFAEARSAQTLLRFACGVERATCKPIPVSEQADSGIGRRSTMTPRGQWDARLADEEQPNNTFQPASARPNQMFVIRRSQMAALSLERQRDFEERLYEYFSRRKPLDYGDLSEEALRSLVANGVRKAEAYGIETERAVFQFTGFMLLFGRDFDLDPQRPWIKAILSEATLNSEARLSWIESQLLEEISPDRG